MCGPPLNDITEEERRKIPNSTDRLIVFEEKEREYSEGGKRHKPEGYHYTSKTYDPTNFIQHKEKDFFNDQDVYAFLQYYWEAKMKYWDSLCDVIAICLLSIICTIAIGAVWYSWHINSKDKSSGCKYFFIYVFFNYFFL